MNKPKLFPFPAPKILTLNLITSLLLLGEFFYLCRGIWKTKFPNSSKRHFTNKNKGSKVVFSTCVDNFIIDIF